MGDKPARRFFVDLRRRNEFDEWGLELQGGWSGGATWVEVAYVRRSTPAARAGIRRGDRILTVNDVFVVFSEVRDVMEVLNRGGALVAWLEVERPTVRAEFHTRDLGPRETRGAGQAGGRVTDIISERYSIRSPRHYNWSVEIRCPDQVIIMMLFRELFDPLPIAELEKIHEIVRQDKHLAGPNIESSLVTRKTLDNCVDFVTSRKANEFVSKYYKRKSPETRGT